MAYRNILTVVDEVGKPDQTIGAAIKLAEKHQAHLAALHVAADPIMQLYFDGPISQDVLVSLREQAQLSVQNAEATFTRVLGQSTLSSDFRSQIAATSVIDEVIAMHARHADLVVLTQSDPSKERASGNAMPEEVILLGGRPVLVIPYVGIQKDFGNHVLVGWDGSREAARAMNDALPILATADKVTVMSVNPKTGTGGTGELAGADIALHLARHDINVEVMHETSHDLSPDQVILSRAAELDIDMLVLGAYGTPRLRERLFGGVTRSLLHEMTVPTLFSH
ncbi:MAG: universal stress protein [Minwuia sp.]|nr:universal stress protein [Minwuia sp.]